MDSMKKNIFFALAIVMLFSATITAQQLTLPQGFPTYTIDSTDNPAEGYFFMGPMPISGNKPGYLIIMDNYGTPIFYRKTTMKTYCFQPYPNGYLAYFEGPLQKYVVMDSSYQFIDTIGCVNCDRFDLHEIRITEEGHYLLIGKNFRIVDMSLLVEGGQPDATIEDYVVQEFDADKNLLFEWKTEDHFDILDAVEDVDLTVSSIDPSNFNSIEVESDTSLLLSFAHMNEITKIDRRTGDIIWRMGGENNQFTFINDTRPFTRQHDVRRLANGNITVFDNGTFSNPFYSRGVEYEVDEEAMTATMVWEYDRNMDVQSTHKGNVQRLPNGNTVVAWGGMGDNPAVPSVTEVDPDGNIVHEVSFPQLDGSYRIFKFPWRTNRFETATGSVDFGNWDGYTESLYLLTIRNNGDDPLDITSVALHGTEFYVDETFPFTIPANDNRNMKVIFYPDGAAEGTEFHDILTLNSDRDSTERIAIQVHLFGNYPDLTSPVVTILPGSTTIPVDTTFRVTFNEPVRLSDDSELTDANAASVITFKETNESGADVPFDATVNAEKTIITITPQAQLTGLQDYYLALEAMVEDQAGNPAFKTSKTYTTTSATDAGLLEENGSFITYPNPVRDILYIGNSTTSSFGLKLYNGIGKIVLDFTGIRETLFSIDLSDLPRGIYYLKIHIAETGEIQYSKVIKE